MSPPRPDPETSPMSTTATLPTSVASPTYAKYTSKAGKTKTYRVLGYATEMGKYGKHKNKPVPLARLVGLWEQAEPFTVLASSITPCDPPEGSIQPQTPSPKITTPE